MMPMALFFCRRLREAEYGPAVRMCRPEEEEQEEPAELCNWSMACDTEARAADAGYAYRLEAEPKSDAS